MSLGPHATGSTEHAGERSPACCPLYHEAVELIGRRWTGAIVAVLLDHGPLRFSEIAQAVPELSDRLLSERIKELEARGVVARTVEPGPPVRVEYALTAKGKALVPLVEDMRSYGMRWLLGDAAEAGARQPAAV